jgi:putative membrane protein
VREARVTLGETLPAVNAAMNATAFVLLVAAWVAVKRKRVLLHRNLMFGALGVSALFLVGYLTRVALTGTHRFPEVGAVRTLYLLILVSHTLLAIVNVPLILRALYLALRRRYDEHRRLVKIAWPVWTYVSLTGVVVYVMLYHVAPALT